MAVIDSLGPVANQIRLNSLDIKVDCPHCHAEQDGFTSDPRGQSYSCESCGEEYTIAQEADLTFW